MCGLSELATDLNAFTWLTESDILLVEESLHSGVPDLFKGYTVAEEYPARITGGRPSGGLLLLIANRWLGSATIIPLERERFLLAVRVLFGSVSFVISAIYVPVHSDDCPEHVEAMIETHLTSLASRFPGDIHIYG